ncbi:hypothetical protein K488DRAFT_83440 [Vararia minispora EC-137]|uniref:Uncharacterized protein n=1 Tax=Vararia minispora EC-137 TaxID=1314806 RepID=A0ACB8QT29_9AGAM|nr:hypothetical protein K488DRAFT_83440 [Vararia minispora EC-137]
MARQRQRKLTLATGEEIDISKKLTVYNEEVIEAMRLRIIELEDRAADAEPPTKRRKTAAGIGVENAGPSDEPTAAQLKKDDKKNQMQIKKLFDRLKKECKAAGLKFQGSQRQVKFDEVLEQAEFDALFKGRGILIQPTPTNKPTSTVTIIELSGAQAEMLFGEGNAKVDQLKGTAWTIGGGPRFAKSEKIGTVDVKIDALEIQYSHNTMKCTLKFDVSQVGGGCGVYGTSHKAYGGGFGGGFSGLGLYF